MSWCETEAETEVDAGPRSGAGRAARGPGRATRTDVDQNDDLANTILRQSTTSSRPPPSQDAWPWLTTGLKFFGYQSVGDLIKSIDIFSLPGKIKAAMKTYSDELSMGQCYMEFTTYSVFSKPDNVFSNFLRSRRGAEGRAIGVPPPTGAPSTLARVAEGLAGLLEGSPTTRQYADLIRQFLPMVLQLSSADDPASAVTTFVTHALGPYLSQVQKPPKTSNALDKDSKPTQQWPDTRPTQPAPPPAPASSPITNMVLQFFKYYMGNYLSSLPGNSGTPPTPPTPTRAPASPHKPPTSPGGLESLLGLFLGNSRPPQRNPRPKPPQKAPQKRPSPPPKVTEKVDSKSFVEMVLEFIRPVFISIIGKAPGESGVDSIREVTRLSSLGRVDDTLVEEVLSPYFCLKNYVVNKAWTLTERGVRSVVGKFDPSEQARMMRMLADR